MSGLTLTGTGLSLTDPTAGTVTTLSVASANGFAGSVATPTTTPVITLSTTITGLLKGDGTALLVATAGTDYVVPGGALGTPSSGVATNLTGLPLTTGTTGVLGPAKGGTGVANNAASTLTIAGNFATTLTVVAANNYTMPTTSATIARTDAAQTFTGIQSFNTPIATGSVATMTATVGGGVPTPPNDATKVLLGNGTFGAVPGGGLTIGTTTITNGTDGRLLWDSGGTTLQETVGASYSSTTQTLTLTPTGNNSALVLTGGTVTASSPILSMTQTWNGSGVTFTGIKLNITSTLSATPSMFLDCQLAGSSNFSVTRNGALTTNSSITSGSDIAAGAGNTLSLNGRSLISSPSNGIMTLQNNAQTDFTRLQFGGTTASFPALKRSTTTLQARLADDSAFTFMQGKLQTDTAYAAATLVQTGSITIYDSTGTAYRVLCLV